MDLLTTRNFNGVALDCYKGDDGDIWLTDEQVGQILGYGQNSINAIQDIHRQHFGRLEKFSTHYEGQTFYNFRGVLEICRWAHGKQADKIFDAVTDLFIKGE